ncbi:MAG: WbqC family protein [Gemmatimonadaceae bacterium]|nr:WbqC family protein [Gemmatimonadaceae bacterium]
MSRVAIVQSNYIPWKGYFDLIRQVDAFVLYDDVQYTPRDWRNRNMVKTPRGAAWMTIPVQVRHRSRQLISEVTTSDNAWRASHWRTLELNYARAPYFTEYRDALRSLYLDSDERRLSAINHRFIARICDWLGITTALHWSMDFQKAGSASERLLDICRQLGARVYLTGPSALAYLDRSPFVAANVEVEVMRYDGYPEYPQRFPPFEHAVSAIDLLLNTGPDASRYLVRAGAP